MSRGDQRAVPRAAPAPGTAQTASNSRNVSGDRSAPPAVDFLDHVGRTGCHQYDKDGLIAPCEACRCNECEYVRARHDVPCSCAACSKRRADQNARWAAGTEMEE